MTVRRKGGRPAKLTPETQAEVVKALSGGATRNAAAGYGGIDAATFYRWMSDGEAGKSPYREFRDAVRTAEASVEVRYAGLIAKAAAEDWRAAAHWLAVRRPAEWGPKVRVTVDAELQAVLDSLERTLPAETYDQVLNAMAQAGDGSEAPVLHLAPGKLTDAE